MMIQTSEIEIDRSDNSLDVIRNKYLGMYKSGRICIDPDACFLQEGEIKLIITKNMFVNGGRLPLLRNGSCI